MGGRGAEIGFINHFGDIKCKVENTFNQDKKTKRNNSSIQRLGNINVVVMASTDDISLEILNPNLKKLHQILTHEEECLKHLKQETLYIRAEKMSNPRTQAVFRYIDKPEIIFNKKLIKSTKADIEKVAQQQIDINYWTKSDKNELVNRVMVHELGHYIQKLVVEKKYKGLNPDKRFDIMYEAGLMHEEINNICLKRFGKPTETSEYGTKDDCEFFAETFAELHTNKKLSRTACALGIYLKEKL